MSVWYRSLVLVGAGLILTGCVDNAKVEEAASALAAAEAKLESATLELATKDKKAADTEAKVAALQAEMEGYKGYKTQVEEYQTKLQDFLKKEAEGLKAVRAADQTVFLNRNKAKGAYVGEIRTATAVYGPGKISDFTADGVLIEQSSGVKLVPYAQLPAEMQNLYLFKPYEPGQAPELVLAEPAPATVAGAGAAPAAAVGGVSGAGEEVPAEVANLISKLKISEVSDSYLRNLLVDAELNLDRIRRKKASIAEMEAKVGGAPAAGTAQQSAGAELTRHEQAENALDDRKRDLSAKINEVEDSIDQLKSSIYNAQSEMRDIPSRVASSYSGTIRPSAAQIKADTEKQSKAYKEAIARANSSIADKNNLITQYKAEQSAIDSERIAISRKISELRVKLGDAQRDVNDQVNKARAEKVDLEYERKDLQSLIDNQKALYLQIMARDTEVKKQAEELKKLRK